MNSGDLSACHYLTSQGHRICWRKGVIAKVEPSGESGSGIWFAPPLLDLQVNGYGGIDFQSDSLTRADLQAAVGALKRDGCAQIFVTLVTDEWPKMLARLRRLKQLRSESLELQYGIAGWHLEGPFMSPEPGYHGAHNPALMLDPLPVHFQTIREIAGSDGVLVTLSPERNGAIEAIRAAVARGIAISLGHTNASAEVLKNAVRAGATSFTHLGNGCPQQLDRHDNIFWRALETPGLTVGLIPDRIHVSPSLFRIFHRQLERTRIWYTTDAVAPAGSPPGRYRFGGLEVDVGADQIVRQPGKSNFAGSALTPIQGVIRAAEMLGCSWRDVWDCFSTVPRHLMQLDSTMDAGGDANFCILETNPSGEIFKGTVYVRGEATSMCLTPPTAPVMTS